MTRTRIQKDQPTVFLSVRVPASVKAWLEHEGGGGRGATSRALRRLVKEEIWRRAGKYQDDG